MSVAITIDNVVKRFGKDTIINGLSVDVRPGEFFTLLGPSGCGKTTLLRMIIGFNSIEGGTIKIDDQIINDIPTHLRNMGMVFQNYAIFPHMSVKDNVAFGLKNRKVAKEKMNALVDEILETVKIAHLKDRMPTQLSGGQQQRVALARAIVIHPQVLLMDEPLSNLDAKLRVEMRNAIKLIQQKIGITTVYVTHDQVEAMTVADRIVVLKDGELQQIAAPDTIYRHPANTFVAGFIGAPSMNILKACFNRDCICIGKAVLPVPELWRQVIGQRRDLLLGIRPEHCRLSEDAAVQGSITYVENTGNQRTVELQLESGENISVTVSDRNADVQNSSGICFSWDDVSLFDVTSGRNIGYIEKGEVFTDAMGS